MKKFLLLTITSLFFSVSKSEMISDSNYNSIHTSFNRVLNDPMFDPEIKRWIDSLDIDFEFKAEIDDANLQGQAPQVFKNRDKELFNQFSKLADRGWFYSNTYLYQIKDFDKYFKKNIQNFKYDYMTVNSTVDIFDRFCDEYHFFKKDKLVRVLRVTFLEGKQFYMWDDSTNKKYFD